MKFSTTIFITFIVLHSTYDMFIVYIYLDTVKLTTSFVKYEKLYSNFNLSQTIQTMIKTKHL